MNQNIPNTFFLLRREKHIRLVLYTESLKVQEQTKPALAPQLMHPHYFINFSDLQVIIIIISPE